MHVILPYNLSTSGMMVMQMPVGTRVLSVGIDPADNRPAIWVEVVDTSGRMEDRQFYMVPSNTNLDTSSDRLRFIGTIPIPAAGVLHVFEVLPKVYSN